MIVNRARRVNADVILLRSVISMRQVAGAILIVLAGLKAIGLVVVLVRGMEDRSTQWLVKQSVYAVTAAAIGWPLLRYKTPDGTK